MAVISSTQFRPTDIVQFISTQSGATAGGTTTALQSSQSTGHIKLFVAPTNIKVLDVQAILGAGATTNTTLRPGWDVITTANTSNLSNTLGAASSSLTASAANVLNIDVGVAPFDTDLPSTTIPAGSIVGVNIVTGASSTTTINGFLVRYRTNVI